MNQEEILKKLRQFKLEKKTEYQIDRIGIFGSAATSKMTRTSDVDVVVELAKQDLFHLIGIKQDLEAMLQRPVDVISYRRKMNQFLKRRIDREALYV